MHASTKKMLNDSGIKLPIICGPMYPCSNPELVAAASAAGAMGIIQPISLTYVYNYDLRSGIRYIRSLTDKPIGMNALIEKSSKKYHQRMLQWIDIALEEGVLFFITSLGNPATVVEKVHASGGVVYHDVTERKWAEKGIAAGVDGLIVVNHRAGGHAGEKSAQRLFDELKDLDMPLVCAGGVADTAGFDAMLDIGYAAVQMGTRFIASTECAASNAYKQAIINAQEEDIVLSERVTGIPVALIQTDYVRKSGLKPNKLAAWLLKEKRSKYLVRACYALRSIWQLKKAARSEHAYWQAGKSVAHIKSIKPCKDIISQIAKTWCTHNR